MELDDLKNTWKKTGSASFQQNIDPEVLEQLRVQRFRAKMQRIILPEIIGSVICIAAFVYIGYNFSLLDTLLLKCAGAAAMLLLLLLPGISLMSTRELNLITHPNMPYAATLDRFARGNIRFVKLQKLNVVLCYLLLVAVVILLSKIVGGKDLSGNKTLWLFSFTIGYIFLAFYAKWVTKHYRKTLDQAGALLQETSV